MFDPLVYASSPAAGRALRDFCALPFDLVRAQYASAARNGLIRPSMLAWRDCARTDAALARLSMGPRARSN